MIGKLSAVCVVALLGAGVAGCGAKGKSPATWADQVCSVLGPWQQDQRTALASAAKLTGTASPAQVRDALSMALDALTATTGQVAEHIQSIGAPDVPSGRAAKGELVATLRRTAGSFTDVKSKLAALSTGDQAGFAKALAPIGGELNSASDAAKDTFARLNTGEIGKAFANSAACKALRPNTAAG